jgi:nitrate/nitrite transport system permease protein
MNASVTLRDRARAGMLSLLILLALLAVWQVATLPQAAVATAAPATLTPEQIEYAKLMGKDPGAGAAGVPAKSGFPTPAQMGAAIVHNLATPFHDNGPNDKGLGLQLAYSLGRVALGYLLAALVAVPLGFAIGMSPLLYRALDPFIQVLKPISPLAWMPLALYTIKDSAASGIFVIFICSVWPMLINTAFGVAGVRREWLSVARTLEVKPLRRAIEVVLPAAAPTILTGMRISMGIAWLVIVAAEMLVGGTGIGYFVWNEWNNLSLPNVILAILVIGVVGMLLDLLFARLQRAVTYPD